MPILNTKVKKHKINPSVLTKDQMFNHTKVENEKEIDRILDKIHKKGIKSLSNNEQKFLDDINK
jgi:hypothetical protein